MLCYPMLWYGMERMICYEISMLCYAIVYVVKDKHSASMKYLNNAKSFLYLYNAGHGYWWDWMWNIIFILTVHNGTKCIDYHKPWYMDQLVTNTDLDTREVHNEVGSHFCILLLLCHKAHCLHNCHTWKYICCCKIRPHKLKNLKS